MQIIQTVADVAQIADPELHQLITDVFSRISDCPEILGFILVAEPGDILARLDAALGFPILANRHELILEHAHWYELVYVLGQDGWGIELFVPKDIDRPELLAMCCLYATPAILP